MGRVCVLLAPGFEEIEAITVIDVLRRADIETITLGVDGPVVEGSHGIRVQADATLGDVAEGKWDAVVLPGGMPGSARLRDDARVQALLVRQRAAGGKLAAICAAPIALSAAGVLAEKKATSYPAFESQLRCAAYLTDRVVVDGDVTTSRGVGTALPFALSLVEQLRGAEVAQQVAERMLVER
jgi:protein deglycase